MQLSSARGHWRKLFVALMILSLAIPFFETPAADAAGNRLWVKIVSPTANQTVSGFIGITHIVTPFGMVGVPARREDNPYRGYAIQYASGNNPGESDFQTYYLSDWTYKSGFQCAATGAPIASGPGNRPELAGGRFNDLKASIQCDRSTYMPPGVGSVRVRRRNGFNFDTTVLPDGPATIRLRGFDINGTIKDDTVVVNVQNKGVEPAYADMTAPKNGDTVSGWVPIAFNFMPQRQGILLGKRNTPWTTFLPSCIDLDINYWKIQYAQGALPEDTELIDWAYSDYGYSIYKDTIPDQGKTRLGPAGCPGSPVFQVGTALYWDSTLVPDGPATIKVTGVYTDGGLKQFYRVVNVQNNGKGVRYFGLIKNGSEPNANVSGGKISVTDLSKPLSGIATIPGQADFPIQGVVTWSYQLPLQYYGCDIAAGDQAGNNQDAGWTFFWVSDNSTWNRVYNAQGLTVGGQTRLPDFSPYMSKGPGTVCRLDTTALPNGHYTIRLRLVLTNGTTMIDTAPVDIQN